MRFKEKAARCAARAAPRRSADWVRWRAARQSERLRRPPRALRRADLGARTVGGGGEHRVQGGALPRASQVHSALRPIPHLGFGRHSRARRGSPRDQARL